MRISYFIRDEENNETYAFDGEGSLPREGDTLYLRDWREGKHGASTRYTVVHAYTSVGLWEASAEQYAQIERESRAFRLLVREGSAVYQYSVISGQVILKAS